MTNSYLLFGRQAGVPSSHWLSAGATEEVRALTLQPTDAVAPTATSQRPTVHPGANTFIWDMQYPGPEVLSGTVHQGRAAGPLAPVTLVRRRRQPIMDDAQSPEGGTQENLAQFHSTFPPARADTTRLLHRNAAAA